MFLGLLLDEHIVVRGPIRDSVALSTCGLRCEFSLEKVHVSSPFLLELVRLSLESLLFR